MLTVSGSRVSSQPFGTPTKNWMKFTLLFKKKQAVKFFPHFANNEKNLTA
ncbi:hypothetical protein BV134_467 [Haemophilus influenzae]|nr:hypothetical protein BV131_490 [Haemophilus influenzae]AVJ04528.1 hypothetical protein BV134_467 [Haemophilus influenzae]